MFCVFLRIRFSDSETQQREIAIALVINYRVGNIANLIWWLTTEKFWEHLDRLTRTFWFRSKNESKSLAKLC